MGMRFQALTVGLVLVTAGVAGCSSTAAGSSGAVQDAIVVSAAPSASAGASSGSSVSAEPVESAAAEPGAPSGLSEESLDSPSEEATITGAEPPSDKNVCDAGLAYACGQVGPGGGVVYYASSTPYACGADMATSCNFLEVAPNGWDGNPVKCPGGCGGSSNKTSDFGSAGIGSGRGFKYCTGKMERLNLVPDASATTIGSGYANTNSMATNCESGNAGEVARRYGGGGKDDWSLPSRDELNALYDYPNRDAVGGFSTGLSSYSCYWSSSELNSYYALHQSFKTGHMLNFIKSNSSGVRPVRSF